MIHLLAFYSDGKTWCFSTVEPLSRAAFIHGLSATLQARGYVVRTWTELSL